MREELKEFKFDWLLLGTVKNLIKLYDNSTKQEKDIAFTLMPTRGNTYNLINQIGDAMFYLLEATEQWLDDLVYAKEKGKKVPKRCGLNVDGLKPQ